MDKLILMKFDIEFYEKLSVHLNFQQDGITVMATLHKSIIYF
jgi:hypothetical protein